MATRMQQRRGTAAQWTSANPILAAGEIGFETDTGKFKLGNGSSTWSSLNYFVDGATLVDGAPDLLNTLNELAAALGDDPSFFNTVATNLSSHAAQSLNVHGIANTANLATTSSVESAISNHSGTSVNVHGIADTLNLETQSGAQDKADAAQAAAISAAAADATTKANAAQTAAAEDATSKANAAQAAAEATAASDATTKANAAQAAAETTATNYTDTHNSDTLGVHGIADTSQLALLLDVSTAQTAAQTAAEATAASALSAHNSETLNVHGIADTSLLATTADVAAVTAASLGLGNVDNTSDADKPVSTATVTAIATAKSEAIAEVTAVIDGAPNALNTLNELAAALGDDANFAGTVATSLAAKVDSYTPITQKTSSYTLSTLDHRDDLIEMGSSSALTLTIPLNSSIAYPVGTSFDVLQTGTGQVTIAGAAGVTVNATPGLKLRTQWSSATVFKRAENTWVVYGDLTA